MGVLMGIWRPTRGQQNNIYLMRKVPFMRCEYIYGCGQSGQGALSGHYMLRDKACTLMSYQGVGV